MDLTNPDLISGLDQLGAQDLDPYYDLYKFQLGYALDTKSCDLFDCLLITRKSCIVKLLNLLLEFME